MNDPHSFAGQAQLGRNLRENLGTTTLGLIERERRYLRHLAIVPHSHCLGHQILLHSNPSPRLSDISFFFVSVKGQ